MPHRPPRRRTESGCREGVSGRASKCPQHLRAADHERPNATDRGYDSRWRKLRARFLQAHPWCRECLREGRKTRAQVVDHVIPKRSGGTDKWENLQALCASCHSRKTALLASPARKESQGVTAMMGRCLALRTDADRYRFTASRPGCLRDARRGDRGRVLARAIGQAALPCS